MDFQTTNITGIIYTDNDDSLPQSKKEVCLYDGYNVEFYRGLGTGTSKGTTLLGDVGAYIIRGGAEYNYSASAKVCVVNASDGKAYHFNVGTGTFTEITTGFTTTAKTTYAEMDGSIIVNDGINDAKKLTYNGSTWAVASLGTTSQRGLAMTVWKNRLFIGSSTSATLYWSTLGDNADWGTTGANGAGSNSNFFNDSTPITALIEWNDLLLIYKKNKIYFIQGGTDQNEWIWGQFSASVGSPSPNGTANYLTEHWMFDNDLLAIGAFGKDGETKLNAEYSDDINEDFENLVSPENVKLIPYHKRDQLRCYVTYSGDDYIKYCWIYCFTKKRWFLKKYPHNITTAFLYDGDIYIGTAAGEVLKDDDGNTFNGTAVENLMLLPFLHFGYLNWEKEVSEILLGLDRLNTTNFTFRVRYNNESDGAYTEKEFSITGADDLIWGEGNWGEKNWAASGVAKAIFRPNKRFETIQIGLYSNGVADRFMVRSLLIKDIVAAT